MKGRITLGIYIAIGFIPVVFGQESIHPKNVPMSEQTIRMPPATIPPGWKVITTTVEPATAFAPLGAAGPIVATPARPNLMQQPIVISFGNGGRVDEHRRAFAGYQSRKVKVEIRGPCYSACTLVLAYVEPDNLCIAPNAFMAFHAIRSAEHGEFMVGATHEFYASMPQPIQQWIKANGGWQNLPLNGYWTMYDRQLWAFGYPKCP